jgi:hypothetical protein
VDWSTAASLATALGTLVLAIATFSAVRSSNRSARVAEAALLAGIRPLLLSTRPQDPPEKIMWRDLHFARVEGGRGVVESDDDDNIFIAGTVRNVGSGLAVLHGWRARTDWQSADPPEPEKFRRLTRDIYIAPNDQGFFQGAIRDSEDPDHGLLACLLGQREVFAVDLMYGDQEGGQRTVTRFGFTPVRDDIWLCSASRHWFIDRDDPR